MKYESSEWVLWPRKIKFYDILISTIWAFISGIIWSLILVIIIFLLSNMLDITWVFKANFAVWWEWIWTFFPVLLTFITFIVSLIVIFFTYFFLTVSDSIKYKKTILHFWHIAFFWIITYIFITPIYLYVWIQNLSNIMYVFIWHIFIISFWLALVLEVLNNYRYILLWFYASCISLFITWWIILVIFNLFPSWEAKLFSLLLILPLINSFIIFFKWVLELAYYEYYKMTWYDQLWDIFYQLEQEEKEQLKEAEEENNLF